MPLRGVLFDLDGVLIDSADAHVRAWQEIFRPYGIDIPPERLHRAEGQRSAEIARELFAEYHLRIDEEELSRLLAVKRVRYRATAPKGMRPDAAAAVRRVRAIGLPAGLVSGSAIENVVAALNETELAQFDVVVTAEDYENGKPDPQPYIIACNKLGLQARECLAVENAPLGIASAKAAGLTVVALTSTLPAAELGQAHHIILNLHELEPLMERIASQTPKAIK